MAGPPPRRAPGCEAAGGFSSTKFGEASTLRIAPATVLSTLSRARTATSSRSAQPKARYRSARCSCSRAATTSLRLAEPSGPVRHEPPRVDAPGGASGPAPRRAAPRAVLPGPSDPRPRRLPGERAPEHVGVGEGGQVVEAGRGAKVPAGPPGRATRATPAPPRLRPGVPSEPRREPAPPVSPGVRNRTTYGLPGRSARAPRPRGGHRTPGVSFRRVAAGRRGRAAGPCSSVHRPSLRPGHGGRPSRPRRVRARRADRCPPSGR